MATTITPATLTVSLTESVTLNGAEENATNTLSISSIAQVTRRILTVSDAAFDNLIEFASAGRATGQKFLLSDCRYVRITNLDNANHLELRFTNSNSDVVTFIVDAGQSFMLGPDFKTSPTTGAGSLTFHNLSTIEAKADTASVDCEFYVASV